MGTRVTEHIPIGSVVVKHGRGRTTFKNIEQLAESIKKNELIQPITVVRVKGEPTKYELVAGERRYRAHLVAQKTTIFASIWDEMDELQRKEFELEENIQRENLLWPEKIELMKQLDDLKRAQTAKKIEKGENASWSQAETAKLIGVSQQQVSKSIALAEKLRKRPDLLEKVKHLPLTVAEKKIRQIEIAEDVSDRAKAGKIKLEVNLLLGSCVDLIKTLDDESVDLILTDPPFAIPGLKKARAGTVASYRASLIESDNSDLETMTRVFQELFPELNRVLKPGGHFYVFFQFSIYPLLIQMIRSARLTVDEVPLIWMKNKTTVPFTGNFYAAIYEPILWGFKGEAPRMLNTSCTKILQHSIIPTEAKVHPFEKPQELLRYLISQSTNLGDTVLDPFAGSASTLLAAKGTGRLGIGFELDEGHFNRAQARLSTSSTKG